MELFVCMSDNYLVYWQLNGGPKTLEQLNSICQWKTIKTATPYNFPQNSGLWDKWPGMEVNPGDSFNMQFTRRFEM